MTVTIIESFAAAEAFRALAERHPEEYRKIYRAKVNEATGITDKHGRALAKDDWVRTPQDEVATVKRIDLNSRRAVLALEGGGSRMVTCHRLVKVPRPRGSRGAVAPAA